MIELEKLNYSYDAINDVIDAKTMEIHHTKHMQTYINNANNILKSINKEISTKEVKENLKNINQFDESIRQGLINNLGGEYNHYIYFNCLAKDKKISDEFLNIINDTFSSFDEFKEKFIENGKSQFGSGWTWLAIKDGKLELLKTKNQDNPVMDGYEVLLGVDVWEHAYYLNYQNKRDEYLEKIFDVINWEYVEKRYNKFK